MIWAGHCNVDKQKFTNAPPEAEVKRQQISLTHPGLAFSKLRVPETIDVFGA